MDITTGVATIYGEWLSKFGDIWNEQISRLQEKFSDQIEEVQMPGLVAVDVPVVYVSARSLIEIMQFLKEQIGFEYSFLSDLTAVDLGLDTVGSRFEVVYQLFSTSKFSRIRIKVRASESESVPSVISVWKGANWAEREVFDMFGIQFEGHPDLRRILMDSRWVGHPLRKDYPLRGYQVFHTPESIDPELL